MKRVSSGIKGLDELLGGGFPKGKCILIVGSPGSGKTTFVMQYLYGGALIDENGLYVAMDERPDQVKENLSGFGWNLEKLEKEGKLFFIDATPLKKVKKVSYESLMQEPKSEVIITIPELSLGRLVRTIHKIVNEENISRIAVDPITSLMLRYYDKVKRRKAMLMFFDALSETGCTSLVTTELRTGILKRSFQLEEFLSQGTILLYTIIHDGNVIRAIQIEKMRGIFHDTQLRPYQITNKGIEVFPKDRIF
ncbi:MAG: ATPase domain-containing protein [Candidatus Bathyarchaeia archaeon]